MKIKINLSRKVQKLILDLSLTVAIAVLNVSSYLVGSKSGDQLYLVAFILVWFNLVFAWFVMKKRQPISYILFATSFVLEALVLINIYWIANRVA
jgi:hypothetical protein